MGSVEGKTISELKDKIFQIFKEFMTGITKLEGLWDAGNRILCGFQQGLGLLNRPPVHKASKLIEKIIQINETNRLKSYVEAGCINIHDAVQSTKKLHTCLLGLRDHLSKAKTILDEIEHLLEDANNSMKTAYQSVFLSLDVRSSDVLDQAKAMEKDPSTSVCLLLREIMDYATLMGIIYSMMRQDFLMQEKIVTSLSLKTTPGELESYTLMWSLRPFLRDEIIHQAWELIPQ